MIRRLPAVALGFSVLALAACNPAPKAEKAPAETGPEAASTAVWASLFPLALILGAAVPVFFPGHDYGLLVIIAAVWFGVTVQSAIKARQAG